MRQSTAGLILCFGLVTAGALQADIEGVSPCTSNTLAFYEGLTAAKPCSVGILLFSNFTFASSGSGASETASDIILNPFANNNNLGGGFTFSRSNPNNLETPPAFTVGAGQSASYIIDWLYIIDPGPVGSGADLGMDPPFGDVVITQDYCLDSDFRTTPAGLGCNNHKTLQSLSVDVANPTASVQFNPPAESYANVRTDIELNGIGSTESSGFDNVSSSQDVVTPEPAEAAVVFAGLLGIAAVRRLKTLRP